MAGYLHGLYTALDERAALPRGSEAGDTLGRSIASLAGTIALGDDRLLPEENEFLMHLLHVEGFEFDGVALTVPDVEPDHFHGCPQCPTTRGPDGIYNAGRLHRGACHTHRTTWMLGSGLFSSWRDETEAQQRERYREIEDYADVDRVAERHQETAA